MVKKEFHLKNNHFWWSSLVTLDSKTREVWESEEDNKKIEQRPTEAMKWSIDNTSPGKKLMWISRFLSSLYTFVEKTNREIILWLLSS